MRNTGRMPSMGFQGASRIATAGTRQGPSPAWGHVYPTPTSTMVLPWPSEVSGMASISRA